MRVENAVAKSVIDSRPNREGLEFSGWDSSLDMFPRLGISWREIEEAFARSGLPSADLGSSYSSFPAEAALRGLPVIPIDLMQPHRRDPYDQFVLTGLAGLRHIGAVVGTDEDFLAAVRAVQRRYLGADIAAIPLPDQCISIAIAHDSIPKHSASLDDFLDRELPEILRVTRFEARLCPLTIEHAEPGGPLRIVNDIGRDSNGLERVAEVASRAGFSFRFFEVPGSGPTRCGVFTRIDGFDGDVAARGAEALRLAEARAWRFAAELPPGVLAVTSLSSFPRWALGGGGSSTFGDEP